MKQVCNFTTLYLTWMLAGNLLSGNNKTSLQAVELLRCFFFSCWNLYYLYIILGNGSYLLKCANVNADTVIFFFFFCYPPPVSPYFLRTHCTACSDLPFLPKATWEWSCLCKKYYFISVKLLSLTFFIDPTTEMWIKDLFLWGGCSAGHLLIWRLMV